VRHFYVYAFGRWFCLVHGWVESPEKVHGGPYSTPVAEIIKNVQPGVTLVEVSA
jgi:hypothetical protein